MREPRERPRRPMTTRPLIIWGYQMPLSWQDRLDAANDEAQVISVVRDFVAQLSPQDISLLPAECRPGKFSDAEDVASYGFALMRSDCSSSDAVSALLHRLAAFVSSACVRLAQIAGSSSHAAADDAHQSA